MLILGAPSAIAQNTKGDKPAPARESRFKTPSKRGQQKRKVTKQKRVRSKSTSVAGRASANKPRRASGKDRPGKPIKPIVKSKPSTKQRAWQGDVAGRRIRTKPPSERSRSNVYPQRGRYVHNPSKKPRANDRPVSNRGTLAVLKDLQTKRKPPGGKLKKVVPRSASRSYIARKSINVYASFPRQKRKGERATTKDLAGRKLRRKNFESDRPGVIAPTFKPYAGRKRVGDRPYSGPAAGRHRSATRPGQHAWQGDLAGRPLRGRNFSSKKSIEGQPILPTRRNKDRVRDRPYRGKSGWYVTATQSGEKRQGNRPLPARTPGIGADRIGKFQGNVKGMKPLKGGGSVSGKLWNNNEQPLVVRTPKQGAQAGLFQGNIKAKRPAKGGGSVSGKLWNNNETPIPGRTPPADAKRIDGYPGKIKRFEVQPGFGDQGETFTGYVKLKKFKKNYIQNPNASDESIKKKRPDKTVSLANGLQVKVKRPGYTENKNASEEALKKLKPSKSTFQAGELQVRVKEKKYGKKPHAAEDALPGIKPTKSSVKASEYARSVKRDWDYIHNPSSADEALKTREPGKAFARSTAYQGNIKMQKFSFFEKNRALHPDTKFIKINKNNVDEERDSLTNFKLWWARLFKKQETQPEHLKYKGKKPRYDKGEDGLWYE